MVEATILFPVMTLIFAALVLISIYLPSQAVLQWSAQYAATVLATEISDTWLAFDEENMTFYWQSGKESMPNVYSKLFEKQGVPVAAKGEVIAEKAESRSVSSKAGNLEVSCRLNNKIIYKEVIVEASRTYTIPVNFSIIGFPDTLTVAASGVSVVQNGDEFVRNVDIATDFAQYAIDKFGLNDVGTAISSFGNEVRSLLGW